MNDNNLFNRMILAEASRLEILQPIVEAVGSVFEQYQLVDLNTNSIGFTASSPIMGSRIPIHSIVSTLQIIVEQSCRMIFKDTLVDICPLDEDGKLYYIEVFIS